VRVDATAARTWPMQIPPGRDLRPVEEIPRGKGRTPPNDDRSPTRDPEERGESRRAERPTTREEDHGHLRTAPWPWTAGEVATRRGLEMSLLRGEKEDVVITDKDISGHNVERHWVAGTDGSRRNHRPDYQE